MTWLVASCTPSSDPLPFADVARATVTRLEAETVPAPTVPDADDELVRRVRARVATLAFDMSPLRPLGLTQAQEWGDAIVPTLVQIVNAPAGAAEERSTALEMLAVLDTPRSAGALLATIESHPVSWVRARAAFRLARTTQDWVLPRLTAARARERDGEVTRWIDATAAHFGCAVAVSERDRRTIEDVAAGTALPRERSQRLVLETWRRVAGLAALEDGPARDGEIEALGTLPDFAADVYAQALLDRDVRVRRGAARALARMGPRAAAAGASLMRSLERDPEVEAEAITALGALHVDAARDEVLARFERASGPGAAPVGVSDARCVEVRVAAARALGRLGHVRAADALEHALAGDAPEALRRAAALSLLELGRERASLPVLCAVGARVDDAEIDRALASWLASRAAGGDALATRLVDEFREPRTAPERAAWLADRWTELVR